MQTHLFERSQAYLAHSQLHKRMTKRRLFFMTASGATAVVDNGFSWGAFAFGPLWAVAKRQWLLFVLLCVAQLPYTALFALAEQRENVGLAVLSLLLTLAYMGVCGMCANRWHRYFLERKGYAFKDFL